MNNTLGPENYPSKDDKHKSKEHLKKFFPRRQQSSFGDLVGVFAVFAEEDEREEEEGMVCAPGNKCPIGAMPKAGEEEDGKRVADDD